MEKMSNICPICLGEPENAVSLCSCRGKACKGCMKCLVESTVSGTHYGSCPMITCPDESHTKSNRKAIPVAKWATLVDHAIVDRYNQLASQVMAFFCGSCHTQRSLDVGFEDPPGASFSFMEQMLTNSTSVTQYEKFRQDIAAFCVNDMTLEDFYTRINYEYFPHLVILVDSEAWDLMRSLLKMISEPERRANLHLRYLRDRPRIHTLCCAREHCFKCTIKDFHDNMSCFEYSSRLDNSLVNCPSCGIYLTRGDGCNSITCLCGHCFDWNAAKENGQRTQDFLLAYPHNTSRHAAEVLCTLPPSDTAIILARAWQYQNRPEVSRGLRSFFFQRFSVAANQYCMFSSKNRLPSPFNITNAPPGLQEASALWQTDHAVQIERCRVQSEVSIKSLFTTLFSTKDDRVIACQSILLIPDGYDAALVSSARFWRDANQSMYKQHLLKLEQRKAKQFLYLYGNRTLLNFTTHEDTMPVVSSFDRGVSDPDLEFTDENRSVRRPGSTSCYCPVAFASPPAELCQFSVVLSNLPRDGNHLTFGLVEARSMPRSSESGVGTAASSWGIGEERSTTHTHCSVLAEGREITQWRSLNVGDVLTSRLNCKENWMEVVLNNDELVHRFALSAPCSSSSYQFAMSFASNAQAVIHLAGKTMSRSLGGSPAILAVPKVVLNKEHSQMFEAFLNQLKTLLDVEGGGSKKQNFKKHVLMSDGKAWPILCGQSFRLTKKIFDAIRPHLLYLVHLKEEHDEHDGGLEELHFLSLNSIIEAVSWFRNNYVEIFEKSDRFHEQQQKHAKSNGRSRQQTFRPKPENKKNKQGAALIGGMKRSIPLSHQATTAAAAQKSNWNAALAHSPLAAVAARRHAPSPVSSRPRQRRSRREQTQAAVASPPSSHTNSQRPPRVIRQTSR